MAKTTNKAPKKEDLDGLADKVASVRPDQPGAHLDKGLTEDEIKIIYDEDGNFVGVGTVDNTFEIRHDKPPLINDLDSVDKEILEEALNSVEIKDWLRKLEKRSRFFKEAFEAFFLMLFRDTVELTQHPVPSQVYLLKLLTEIISHEDYEKLHESCIFSRANSALGSKTLVSAINELLSDEDLEMLQKLDEAAQNMQGVLQQMASFMQGAQGNWTQGNINSAGYPICDGEGSLGPEGTIDPETGEECSPCEACGKYHPPMRPKTPKEKGMTAEEAREHLREMTKQFSELMKQMRQKIEETMEKLAPKAEVEVPKAVEKSKGKVDQAMSFAQDFGTEPGEYNKIPMDEILAISRKYENDRSIRDVLDQIGRMQRVARKTMRTMTEKVDNMQNKPSIRDDNLVTLMPHEMVKSRHPVTKTDFKKRLMEKEVECFDTRGERRVNRGPIIVCKDTSGSMNGAPNTWSSGFFLTLAAMARKQRREAVLINFGCSNELKCYEFSKNAKFTDYIDSASFMFGGGTDFQAPLQKAADYISQSAYDKADVLFITDGHSYVSEEFLKEFKKLKKQRDFKVITVVINVWGGREDVVESFSEKVFYLSDLQKDEDVLNTAFAF